MATQELQSTIDLLRRIHLFTDLTEEQLTQVAAMFHREQVPKGVTLITQGAVGDRFYILARGRVRVTRRSGRTERWLATLVPGDYFGEEALLIRQRRTATVTTLEPVTVLWLDYKEFRLLTKTLPVLRERFAVVVESRRLSRRLRFNWLGKDEVIYLLARKHATLLYHDLVFPVFLIGFGLLVTSLFLLTGVVLPLWIGLGIVVAGAALGVWRWIDWQNDYYLMTNYRVVWVERVVGLYESRVEAPLRSILSISVSTDQLGRMLNYGDVVVRTYTGKIVLRHVSHPDRMREFMEEHWQRTRRLIKQDEEAAMDRAIRERLGLPVQRAYQEPELPALQPQMSVRQPGWATVLMNRLFRTRYEEEGAIVYRKHWFVLLRRIWRPALGMMACGLFFLARAANWIRLFSVRGSLVLSLLGGVVALGFMIYEYLDWSNDIYRVTPDHIIDVDRKPFGREQLNSAPLDNILSMEHERRGVLGLMLNFGPVRIRIGSTTFVFEDVSDPAQVQNEIFRRMEVLRRRKAQAEAEKERRRMAEWLAVYHRNVEEYRRQQEEAQGSESGEE